MLSSIPSALGPGPGEAAALSVLAAREGDKWTLVAGSLLTVPISTAMTSWSRWTELQPQCRTLQDGFDLGPSFVVEPFAGVRGMRAVVPQAEWGHVALRLEQGAIESSGLRCDVHATDWTSTVLIAQDGGGEVHQVVAGAERPVTGVVASLEGPPMPSTESTWEWQLPPHLSRGPDLGRIAATRKLLFWPRRLLGIEWLGDEEFAPVRRFAVGRAVSKAWIAQIKPKYDTQELVVSIGWDERAIDPLGCTLVVRSETDGLPLVARAIRISDLPSRSASPADEPRHLPWDRRTLDVALPRGARRTDFGVALMGPDGQLLDERPVVARVEQISLALHVNGGTEPASVLVVGDREEPPSAPQRDEAVAVGLKLEAAAREAAAERRISTAGDLGQYLRWRFSCRAAEALILDPYLVASHADRVVDFLKDIDRPVRALVRSVPEPAREALADARAIELRLLPHGSATLHDRVWTVGDTAVLVGASLNELVRDPTNRAHPATTVTELPHGDVAIWRRLFEQWWSR